MPTTAGPATTSSVKRSFESSRGRLHAVEFGDLAEALGCAVGEFGHFLRAGVEAGTLAIRSGPAGTFVLVGATTAYWLGLARRPAPKAPWRRRGAVAWRLDRVSRPRRRFGRS
ncbi:MAG TPA: hypothetical protein VG406_04360 [Isosphaeraceae bacterium]|nr:hypothetical protein [Isosphaeraceae bacterium]